MPSAASSEPRARRPYNSARRSRQAAQTRQDIVLAAIAAFGSSGWSGTTLTAIAERAGVAVETIYSGFGSKKKLLRTAMEAAVVGDAEELPLIERPEWQRMTTGSRRSRIEAGAALLAEIHERSAAVWRAVMDAAGADAEVDRWRTEMEAGRRVDTARAIEAMLGIKVEGERLELIWAAFGPEVYLKLTADAGLDRAAYQRCMVEVIDRLGAR